MAGSDTELFEAQLDYLRDIDAEMEDFITSCVKSDRFSEGMVDVMRARYAVNRCIAEMVAYLQKRDYDYSRFRREFSVVQEYVKGRNKRISGYPNFSIQLWVAKLRAQGDELMTEGRAEKLGDEKWPGLRRG